MEREKKEKRKKEVMVRFSESEYDLVVQKASELKLRVAEFCRLSALNSQIKVVKSRKLELDQNVMINLYRIGSNLNQLLLYLNRTKAQYLTYEEVLDCLALLAELRDIYNSILSQLQK